MAEEYYKSEYKGIGVSINVSSIAITEFEVRHRWTQKL